MSPDFGCLAISLHRPQDSVGEVNPLGIPKIQRVLCLDTESFSTNLAQGRGVKRHLLPGSGSASSSDRRCATLLCCCSGRDHPFHPGVPLLPFLVSTCFISDGVPRFVAPLHASFSRRLRLCRRRDSLHPLQRRSWQTAHPGLQDRFPQLGYITQFVFRTQCQDRTRKFISLNLCQEAQKDFFFVVLAINAFKV